MASLSHFHIISLTSLLLLFIAPCALSLSANAIKEERLTFASDSININGPIHVFRDPATGNLVESSEPETTSTSNTATSSSSISSSADDATELANELDALYMDDVAVRSRNRHIRGGLSDRLGRKSLAGMSSDSTSDAFSASTSASTGRRQKRSRVIVTGGIH